MATKQPVWGIDVGQCSLKALKILDAGEGVEMLACDVVEHDNILSQAESDATTMVIKAIETFAGRNNFKGCRVVISVPGQQTLTRFTKMPPVEPKKIPDMVQYEASQQIPFDMDEVVWDYQVFQEKDSPDVEVGIFAIRKELIRNYISYFTDLGIEPIIVQTSPMASYNTARFEQAGEEGKATVLLDMGALATDLIVMEGNKIWSRPVPIGGNRFTEALVSAFKISFAKAEKLKRHAATSKYARQVFQAMRPVFADLVSEIQRSIGYYTSTHRDAHVTRVVGMGNAFQLPGLQKFLQQNLQIDVERLTGFKKMAVGQPSEAYTANVMSFAVAYGLCLQGIDKAQVTSNLVPLEVRKSILWKKKRPWFAAAAACLALGAGSLWIGNTLVGNQIASAVGSLTNIGAIPVRDAAEAERIVSGTGTEVPVEAAARILGAAQKLQQEFAAQDQKATGDAALLQTIAKLPAANILVPQVLEVIHRGVAETNPPALREIQSGRDYAASATQLGPRPKRQELWITSLRMAYNPKDPTEWLQGAKEGASQLRSPGWLIKVVGRTTDPNPTKLIEEQFIPRLQEIGREPKRGFFVDMVKLNTVTKPSPTAKNTLDALPTVGETGPMVRGRGRVVPRDEGARGGAEPAAPRGGRGMAGIGLSPGGTGTVAIQNLTAQVEKLKKNLENSDLLTDESKLTDQQFTMDIIVRKQDIPENLIPEKYKPKKEEKDTEKKPPKPGG